MVTFYPIYTLYWDCCSINCKCQQIHRVSSRSIYIPLLPYLIFHSLNISESPFLSNLNNFFKTFISVYYFSLSPLTPLAYTPYITIMSILLNSSFMVFSYSMICSGAHHWTNIPLDSFSIYTCFSYFYNKERLLVSFIWISRRKLIYNTPPKDTKDILFSSATRKLVIFYYI